MFKAKRFLLLMFHDVQDIGRNSGRQVRAGAGRLGGGGGGGGPLGGALVGGGGAHGTNDDFWLPKVRHLQLNQC